MLNTETMRRIIDRLTADTMLDPQELKLLLKDNSNETAEYLREQADMVRRRTYGNSVYIRGLIEFTNYCKNDCYYCGIRCSNKNADRYRLSKEDILNCCETGHELGFRTFVLQGGEDPYWTDERLVPLIEQIKGNYPDCALTLSIGERTPESYRKLRAAGADRYLLRHETADPKHYGRLHPAEMSHSNRIECLRALKSSGFQTGCGFMVGSPFQTIDNIIGDLMFIKEFQPEMVGIGPFIPASNTPFVSEAQGSVEMTLKLISIIRLMNPMVLLPATTALGTASEDGRAKGIRAGANVVMPNLSPVSVRKKYNIYDNKLATGCETAESLDRLCLNMEKIGYNIEKIKGNYPTFDRKNGDDK